MKFLYPDKLNIKTLNNLARRIYKEDLYGFVKNLGQKVFVINTSDLSYVLVVDNIHEKIELFYHHNGLVTCHNMFSGDVKSLTRYDYTYLSVEFFKDSDYEPQNNAYYHYYKHKNGHVLYFSLEQGQRERVINEDESIHLIEALQYLFHIKTAFDLGDENLDLNLSEEYVVVFDFDDVNLTYQSNYLPLNSFDFLPNMELRSKKNKKVVDSLKDQEIIPGVMYLGALYGDWTFSQYKYDKYTSVDLKPTIVYYANENGDFDYQVFGALSIYQKREKKKAILEMILKNGLYDTVVTDNYQVLEAFQKDFEAYGIEMRFDTLNNYHNFFNTAIMATFSFQDTDVLNSCLVELKKNLKDLLPDIKNFEQVEIDDEELIKEAEEYFDDNYLDDDEDDSDDFNLDNHTNLVS